MDKMGKASQSVIVKTVDLAQHCNLGDLAQLNPPPDEAVLQAWTEESQLDSNQLRVDGDPAGRARNDVSDQSESTGQSGYRNYRRSKISAKANVKDNEGKAHLLLMGEAFSTHRFNLSVVPIDGSDIKAYPFAQNPYLSLYIPFEF